MDVAVVGAGFGGLALASACADAGLSVAVLERRPRLAPEGVGLVLQPNGLAALDRLGVLGRILETGQRITTVRQCDDAGRVRAEASYAELDHPHPYLAVVERTRAIAILAERLPEAATLRCGVSVTALERDAGGRVTGVRYAEADGAERRLAAACVVGADGVGSVVRKAMGSRLRWRTGPDRYLIGIAPCDPESDAGTLFCGRGWCDGVMPYRGQTYFFDHITAENQDAVERRDFGAWREIYARRVPEGERIAAAIGSFDSVGFLSGRTHRVARRARPGVTLLGDAAAAVHPHNGQGANLALGDAMVLGAALAEHGPLDDGAIAAYAAARDAKLRLQVPWSIFIGRTFDGTHAGWRANRSVGYLASRVPAVRRATSARQAGIG